MGVFGRAQTGRRTTALSGYFPSWACVSAGWTTCLCQLGRVTSRSRCCAPREHVPCDVVRCTPSIRSLAHNAVLSGLARARQRVRARDGGSPPFYANLCLLIIIVVDENCEYHLHECAYDRTSMCEYVLDTFVQAC